MTSEQKKLLQQLSLMGDVKFIQRTRAGLIKKISEMDIDSIDDILDSSLYYQNVPKQLFLEKLADAFNLFSKEDDFLIAHEGKCVSQECHNKSKNGVAFVGNNSGRFLTLIIEQFEDKTIKDIYCCSDFCASSYEIDENKQPISIKIFNDEKVNFSRTAEFNYQDIKALQAIDDVRQFENNDITIDSLMKWRDNYLTLYESLGWYMKYKNLLKFADFFSRINNLCTYHDLTVESKIAIELYNLFEDKNELELLKWLVQHEHLYRRLNIYTINSIVKHEKLRLFTDLNIYISKDIFATNFSIEDTFYKHYQDKIRQYNTMTPEQYLQLNHFDDEIYLGYHLRKRGII